MKLVILTDFWQTPEGGGINQFVTNLVSNLKKNYSKLKISIIFIEGYDKREHHISKNRFFSIVESLYFLIKLNGNIIHVHESWILLMSGAIYKLFNPKIKLIYTFHSQPEKPRTIYKKIKFFLRKKLFYIGLKKCDYITFVSIGLKNTIRKRLGYNFPNSKITYAGIDIRYPTLNEINLFQKKFNINKKNVYLLGLGLTAIYEKKEGAKLLINAILKMIIQYPNIRLILTRDGKYSEELKQYVKDKHIEKYIIFTGNLENPYSALICSNIYTHISFSEGLPIALLEAMAFGKPIVASKIGGIPEAIKNNYNGILINNTEVEIITAIKKLLSDDQFKSLIAKNAKLTSKKYFNWKTSIKKFLDLYMS